MKWWRNLRELLSGIQREFRPSQWLGRPDDVSRFKAEDSERAALVADEIRRRETRPGSLEAKKP